jgi:hypothetical protein
MLALIAMAVIAYIAAPHAAFEHATALWGGAEAKGK